MNCIDLNQSPRVGRNRSWCGIMWSFPYWPFLQESETIKCSLNRREWHCDTFSFEFVEYMLTTSPSSISLFNDLQYNFFRQCSRTCVGTGWPCLQSTPPCGHGESAPSWYCWWFDPKLLCNLPHRPPSVFHQINGIHSNLGYVRICCVWHIFAILTYGCCEGHDTLRNVDKYSNLCSSTSATLCLAGAVFL